MTKYLLTKPGGPWDFPALGFSAVDGAILNGDLPTTNTFPTAPGPEWSVYAGGSAETGVTRYAPPSVTVNYSPTPVPAGLVTAVGAAYDATIDAKVASRVADTASATGIAVAAAIVTQGDARYNPRSAVTSVFPQTRTTQIPSGGTIMGIFGNTLLWWNSFGIAQSDDGGATWAGKTVPPDAPSSAATAGHARMVLFKGYWYLQYLNTSGVPTVRRTPVVNRATAFSWSGVIMTGSTGSGIISTGIAADDTALQFLEYGDPVGGPKHHRSTDGTTEIVQSLAALFGRHGHGVFIDPYNPGHVYISGGDAGSTFWFAKSTDYGATFVGIPGWGQNAAYQSVQMSFTATDIYIAPDNAVNWSAIKVDRATQTPKWIGKGAHRMTPVPGGLAPRKVTDLASTSGSTTVTSASAAFTAADVGSRIRTLGQDFAPIDTYIASVTNSTTAVMTTAATASAGGIVAVIGGEHWGAMAYYGAIDPATGIYYFVSINGGVGGNVDGLFCILPDGHLVLLDILTTSPDGRVTIDTVNNRVYVRGFYRPLLAV